MISSASANSLGSAVPVATNCSVASLTMARSAVENEVRCVGPKSSIASPSELKMAASTPSSDVQLMKPRMRISRSPNRSRCCAPATTMIPHHQAAIRSEEHTSELQSLMRISYAVFCLKKKKKKQTTKPSHKTQTQTKNISHK